MFYGIRKWFATGLLLLAVAGPAFNAALAQDARKVKSKTDPAYPELAKRMHIAGVVKVEVSVAPSGAVKSAKVMGGNPVLAESALEAVKRWKFESGPEETSQIVEFRFNGQ